MGFIMGFLTGAVAMLLYAPKTGDVTREELRQRTEELRRRIAELPGFGEMMRIKSMEKTPRAMISRAIAGIRGKCLIVNLPGSPRGAVENLEAVWPAVPPAVEKIQGDQTECAAP